MAFFKKKNLKRKDINKNKRAKKKSYKKVKRQKFNKNTKFPIVYGGQGYIPARDLTDPVDFALSSAVRYDSSNSFLKHFANFKVEEARLLKKINDG